MPKLLMLKSKYSKVLFSRIPFLNKYLKLAFSLADMHFIDLCKFKCSNF